jgi:glycerophosphoryl diester phosphodiesterase
MLCIGHRGAMGYAPENTLKSIEKALALKTPWVEVDVFYADDHLVVIHDDRLERTTNGSGYICDRTFAYLRTLDAGDGQQIPTLEEVLDLVAGRAGINIELKGPETAKPVVNLIREKMSATWDSAKFMVSSFNHHEIKKVRALDDRIRTGALIAGIPIEYAAFAQELGAYSVNQSREFVNSEFVRDAHRRGLKVFVYTVDHPEDMQRMQSLGVDGLFSNYPDRVLSFLRANSGKKEKQ